MSGQRPPGGKRCEVAALSGLVIVVGAGITCTLRWVTHRPPLPHNLVLVVTILGGCLLVAGITVILLRSVLTDLSAQAQAHHDARDERGARRMREAWEAGAAAGAERERHTLAEMLRQVLCLREDPTARPAAGTEDQPRPSNVHHLRHRRG